MKITDLQVRVVHVNQRGNWVFLRIHTDSGITGWGEVSQTGNDRFMVEILDQITPRLIDEDPFDITRVCNLVNPLGPFTNRFARVAASGVEMALWDIYGKAMEQPVYRLLGGAVHPSIRLYANINRGLTEKTPEAFCRMARRAVESGFPAVKCDPFDGVYRFILNQDSGGEGIEAGIERLRAIRAEIGDEVKLLVDCHARFNAPAVKETCARLEEFNLYWIEDPVNIEHTKVTAEIRDKYSPAMAGGEIIWNRYDFRKFLDADCVDILMPDVKYCGGIKEVKWASALADTYGVLVSPHGPSGPISLAAGAQAMLGESNFLTLEYSFGEVDWRDELTAGTEQIVGGEIPLPELPGLGVELNEKALEKYAI